jgi:hypothetical protein
VTLERAAWRQGACQALIRDVMTLPGSAGDVGGDDIGGVPVEGHSGAVVSHGGARVGVRGGFLHVPQRDACVESGRDECVAQPGRRGGRAGGRSAPRRARSSRSPAAVRKMGPSQRSPTARSIARAVRGASGMTAFLSPLRVIAMGPVPALGAERFDVGAGGLGYPQPR